MNLADLRALGVEISLSEEGKVRLRAAPGVLTPKLKQAIVEAKPQLLDELRRHRQEPVNVVNMVNFDAHCLTTGIGPSPVSRNDHRAPASETVTDPNPSLTRQEKHLSESIGCVPEKYPVALQARNL